MNPTPYVHGSKPIQPCSTVTGLDKALEIVAKVKKRYSDATTLNVITSIENDIRLAGLRNHAAHNWFHPLPTKQNDNTGT